MSSLQQIFVLSPSRITMTLPTHGTCHSSTQYRYSHGEVPKDACVQKTMKKILSERVLK